MSTREENNQKQKRNARRANGAVVAIVFFFLDLVLFGVFGKAGNEIADFLIGIFGYAIYGYCLASTLLGVLMCFNIKPKQGVKIILLYVSIAVLVVMFAHILASHSLALTGWNNYIKQSYIGANTAGGRGKYILISFCNQERLYSKSCSQRNNCRRIDCNSNIAAGQRGYQSRKVWGEIGSQNQGFQRAERQRGNV